MERHNERRWLRPEYEINDALYRVRVAGHALFHLFTFACGDDPRLTELVRKFDEAVDRVREAHEGPAGRRISDDEARIRAWVELKTVGRDDPNAPVRPEIADLQKLLAIIDGLRSG